MGGGALWSFVPPHHSLLPTAQPSFPPPPRPPPALSPSPGRREAEGHLAPSREASPRFLDGVDETRQGKGGDTA